MKNTFAEKLLEADHTRIGELVLKLCASMEEREVESSFKELDYIWARLAVHIRAEHLCLFPAILDAAKLSSASEGRAVQLDEAQSAINQLRDDHDFFMRELAVAVNTMRERITSEEDGHTALADEVRRGVRETLIIVGERLERHNKLEEERVYRWPATLLSATRQAELADCVRQELENMPPRFAGRTRPV